ncbi:TonB-dependent receptor [Gammaproteobacteria bacterium]|nr:TonB-dependent receptor [Gammaproteobacteria bacterium]
MKLTKPLALSRLACCICSAIAGVPVFAQTGSPTAPDIEEIVVFGRARDLVGTAEAASEGSIGGADLLVRPLFKTAELLESMPGMIAVQHSGSGKANQFFLRGFNLDHGTDYTVFVDGMPMNLRSHGHGQGYLDVNGLIPETVERIDYRKGPYRADLGDFSMAGASFIHTIDSLDNNFLSMESGQYGWRRVAGGASQNLQNGSLTLVGEYKQNDGPWQKAEDLNHVSLWSKYLRDTDFGQFMLTVSAYEADWDPTEQVPERAFGTSACADAFCALDPTAEGETSRWIVTSELTGDDWGATLYAQHYDWTMSSNPTYDAQINQFDKRWTMGGKIEKTLIEEMNFQIIGGGNFRYDDGSRIGVEQTDRGVFVEDIAANSIQEASYGAFVEATWYATDSLRVIGGLRGDYYDFDVTALNALSVAGTNSDNLFSPKIALAWQAMDDLELYANWGRGFHSNDARGVVNRIDPVPGLSRGEGRELGARLTLGDFKFTSSYWWLDQDSELIFVGDSNSVEPKGGSERDGYELTMFWQPMRWIGVDAVYTHSNANYVNNPDGKFVEGAVEEAGQIGISASRDNWDLALRARYLGPYALTADNTQRSEALTTVSIRGAWHFNKLTAYAEVINLLDTDNKEIVYYYPAYVPGLDPADQSSEDIDCAITNCTISRATVPQSFRMGVSYKF